jgi:lipopolysaccharide transport system permease protein
MDHKNVEITTDSDNWDLVIDTKNSNTTFNLKELIRYKDLILMFVKRDFISLYKQTILGPLWVIIQPVLTTITFTIVFGKIAQIDTGENVPSVLFYMLGVTTWAYFADCVTKTSDTFTTNQNIFGKVYFPRIVVPLSIVISNLIKFGVQFGLFLILYFYFYFFKEPSFQPSTLIFLTPVLLLAMAILSLGVGIIISSLTTKYRDLKFLIQFGIQLAMYATPIVYPLNSPSINDNYRFILQLNPMTNIIEGFKAAFFGYSEGVFSWFWISYSIIISITIMFIGSKIFNKIEKSFVDTI